MSLDHLAQKAQMELEASLARKGPKETVALLVIFFFILTMSEALTTGRQGWTNRACWTARPPRHTGCVFVQFYLFDHRLWLTRSQVRQAT